MYQSYYGLIHHLGSPPWIGVLSLGCVWSTGDSIGVPSNPSYIPDALLSYGDHMTFYERLTNSLSWLWSRLVLFHLKRNAQIEGIMINSNQLIRINLPLF